MRVRGPSRRVPARAPWWRRPERALRAGRRGAARATSRSATEGTAHTTSEASVERARRGRTLPQSNPGAQCQANTSDSPGRPGSAVRFGGVDIPQPHRSPERSPDAPASVVPHDPAPSTTATRRPGSRRSRPPPCPRAVLERERGLGPGGEAAHVRQVAHEDERAPTSRARRRPRAAPRTRTAPPQERSGSAIAARIEPTEMRRVSATASTNTPNAAESATGRHREHRADRGRHALAALRSRRTA